MSTHEKWLIGTFAFILALMFLAGYSAYGADTTWTINVPLFSDADSIYADWYVNGTLDRDTLTANDTASGSKAIDDTLFNQLILRYFIGSDWYAHTYLKGGWSTTIDSFYVRWAHLWGLDAPVDTVHQWIVQGADPASTTFTGVDSLVDSLKVAATDTIDIVWEQIWNGDPQHQISVLTIDATSGGSTITYDTVTVTAVDTVGDTTNTTPVLFTLNYASGSPMAYAIITLTLETLTGQTSTDDSLLTVDSMLIFDPYPVKCTTNVSGLVQINLYPNSLFLDSTWYHCDIRPKRGRHPKNFNFRVPDTTLINIDDLTRWY